MKVKALILSAIFAACVIPTAVQAVNNEEGGGKKKAPNPTKVFEKLDADKSEGLSKDEVAKNKGLTKQFDKLDTDKSGELSLEEFKAAKGKKSKKDKKAKEETGDE
ncbi:MULTISPECIES: hypothetical protein [unclassified Lentimonas]|nr:MULTISPECIES: hypothetical protein [unclassified Lentimonas]CAA6684580.1 Unannotated [Lentimonas sp. CC6]CAA7170601.1 Unannotated [Lentimonas sp. CC21]CAA7183191.1 Unannotated [Lentimonas sp. CC8]CAA6676755.1 Unannotated [Lentimonas sp. CC4]CAA6694197.1 Unannotated [Lentimonas sp. CC10]